MSIVQLRFFRCIQDSQDLGSTEEHMVSRVFFSVIADGVPQGDFTADVKQPVGSSYEDGPLEVTRPTGYRGPFDYEAFRRCVERYYRGLVGSGGRGIRITGANNVRMRDNHFEVPGECGFAADTPSGDSW